MTAHAVIQTKTIEYKDGDTVLEGFVAYDDAIKGARPGVLIVHQWMGLTDYEKKRAEMLAQLGCVAFCTDVYGKGVRPKNREEAGVEASKYRKDRLLLRPRSTSGCCRSASNPALTRARSNSRSFLYLLASTPASSRFFGRTPLP